ncbi:MAG: AAA family ATPase, partial [Prevotellaceae bacterium]|nr:AAA family ATPase [Prevotellaceae bacterium]
MAKNYLKRSIDDVLITWSRQEERKPVLLRGARQVGKSSSVRELAKHFEHFIEVNFEKEREVHSIFSSDLSPQKICRKLSVHYHIPVTPGKTLLFLDEIQACPNAISSLRFFYEDYPELHVIAAGSLLEFALENLPSFGVGRIKSLFMYPFSFSEFMMACGERQLWEEICEASPENPLSDLFHNKAKEYLKQFLIIGGMPAAVAAYVKNFDILACQEVLDDLINSLKSDFTKYSQRVPEVRISTVFNSVVQQIGGKFTYAKIGQEYNHRQLKESLELLQKSGLVIPVIHSAAAGIPLGAQINPQKQKMLLLDTGILQRLLGLPLSPLLLNDDFSVINKGSIAELFVGLELLKAYPSNWNPQLYYWQREKPGSHAEVDYVIQKNENIIPIEVKSGTTGAMQSLHLFMKEKNITCGIRTSLENFAQYS